MLVAVSSVGTSLDAWTGIPFGICSQFLVVDTETNEVVVLSVPPEHQDPSKVSLFAIRGIARQGAEVVITGPIKDVCKQTMLSLGMDVVDNVGKMRVREAIQRYARGGEEAVRDTEAAAELIAVASHGTTLDALVHEEGEPCTSFVLVDPRTMELKVVRVPQADSPGQASVNSVRAAAMAGATVVITSGLKPECCVALRALAITVAVASPGTTVREAVESYSQGRLAEAPFL